MPTFLLQSSAGAKIPLPELPGLPKSAHVIDLDSILAINAALASGRPLLVRGEPGTGKSQLARAAATALGRALVQHAVDARTEPRDLLWSLDTVARLAEAQLIGSLKSEKSEGEASVKERMAVAKFLHPGPLWWAFDWTSAAKQANNVGTSVPSTSQTGKPDSGVVVLVDEIDKADPSVPNGLLDALGHGRFDVPGRDAVCMRADCPPLVVITTNEERSLPDAFLRRCLVLHLSLPTQQAELEQVLVARGRAHFEAKDVPDSVLRAAAKQLVIDREQARRDDLSPPGLAEYIDLLRAVSQQKKTEEEQLDLLKQIAKFAYKKHPQVSHP